MLNNRETTGARGERMLGGKEFESPPQASSLPLETQSSPAHFTHLTQLHLLSPVYSYKEECTALLSSELSLKATQLKEKEHLCEISSLITKGSLKLSWKVL